MNIQRARQHLARANEILGFGKDGDEFPFENLPSDLQINIWNLAIKDDLHSLKNIAQVSKQTGAARSPAVELYDAWRQSDAEKTKSIELVKKACEISPLMFGYASESLQKDRALAKWVFEKDQKAILSYANILHYLWEEIETEIRMKREDNVQKLFQIVTKPGSRQPWYHSHGNCKRHMQKLYAAREEQCTSRLHELIIGSPPPLSVLKKSFWKEFASMTHRHYIETKQYPGKALREIFNEEFPQNEEGVSYFDT